MSDVQYYLYPTLPAVRRGDFNMVENFKLDRKGGRPRGVHTYGKDALGNLKNNYSLVDIWRELNLNKNKYTWNCRYDYISSRYYRIYVKSAWTSNVTCAYIHPFVWSDHDMCTINFYLQQEIKRGRGIWKMNLSHIEDETFQFLDRMARTKNKLRRYWFMVGSRKNVYKTQIDRFLDK